jgi:hypothetical protein
VIALCLRLQALEHFLDCNVWLSMGLEVRDQVLGGWEVVKVWLKVPQKELLRKWRAMYRRF